jgi:hypothetical protein
MAEPDSRASEPESTAPGSPAAEPDSTAAEPDSTAAGPESSASVNSFRELAENVVLAGLGLLDAARQQAVGAVGSSGGGQPLRERAQSALAGLVSELGLVTRERYEELELKVAQLEHRVRLLEGQDDAARDPGSPQA